MSNDPFVNPPAEPTTGWGQDPAPGGVIRPASVGKRVGAFIIDYICLLVLVTIIISLTGLGANIISAAMTGTVNTGAMLGAGILSFAVFFAYFVLLEGTSGQTVAKRLLGIKVVSADGSPATIEGALKRRLPLLIGIVPRFGQLLSFLAFLGMLITAIQDEPEHRGFHDKWGGTKVVEA